MDFYDKSRSIGRLLTVGFQGQSFGPQFRPAADVYRIPGGWLIKMELAGVRKHDIEVLSAGHSLIVRGRRRDGVVTRECECISLEITYSSFERRIELPIELTQARIDFETCDGMLLIQLSTEAVHE